MTDRFRKDGPRPSPRRKSDRFRLRSDDGLPRQFHRSNSVRPPASTPLRRPRGQGEMQKLVVCQARFQTFFSSVVLMFLINYRRRSVVIDIMETFESALATLVKSPTVREQREHVEV